MDNQPIENQPEDNQFMDDQQMDQSQGGTVFVSVDADNMGREVGGAILSDDIERLHQVSQSINAGQNLIMDWAENNGGQVISAGGDEAIIQVPESALGGLEDLRSQYAEMVGTSLTVGIGSKPSEAGKALLYGKLNGKDQINDFHPEMDDFLMEAHQHVESGLGSEEEQKQDEAYLSDVYGDKSEEDQGDDSFDEDMGSHPDEIPEQSYADQDMQDDTDYQSDLDHEQHPEVAGAVEALDEAGVQEGSDEDDGSDMKDAMKDELSQTDSSLKQKLAEVLEAYKMDKENLEQMSSENPEMYAEVVQLLQQMINVAKMLSNQSTSQSMETIPMEQQSNVADPAVGKQIP